MSALDDILIEYGNAVAEDVARTGDAKAWHRKHRALAKSRIKDLQWQQLGPEPAIRASAYRLWQKVRGRIKYQ